MSRLVWPPAQPFSIGGSAVPWAPTSTEVQENTIQPPPEHPEPSPEQIAIWRGEAIQDLQERIYDAEYKQGRLAYAQTLRYTLQDVQQMSDGFFLAWRELQKLSKGDANGA